MLEPRLPSQFDDERAEQVKRNQGPLGDSTAEVLTRIYVARRLNYQLEYYQTKLEQFQNNEDNAFRLNAIIMTLTSLFAALGTQENSPEVLRLLTAVLPAFAALVAGFRQLYQWDRQSQLFKDTILGLQRASLVLPDADQIDRRTAASLYPSLVETTEKVFEDEVSQWGQIALGDQQKETEQEELLARFAEEFGIDIYDAQGNLDPAKLGAVSEVLRASRSGADVSALSLSVDYPAVEAGENPLVASDGEIEAEEHAEDEPVVDKVDTDSHIPNDDAADTMDSTDITATDDPIVAGLPETDTDDSSDSDTDKTT